jgi:hypothetical protein
MSPAFDTAYASDLVFRVARRPDVWQWTDWRFAGFDGTFGGRWDDPQGRYRALYASRGRLGAYLEVLADFRPDLELVAALREIVQDDDGAATAPPGIVPAEWRSKRLIASGITDGVQEPLVVVGGAESLATLRSYLASLAADCGVADVDAAAIRQHAPRRFTQGVSRFVYEQVREDGSVYAGILYLSRFGDDVVNYALFERGDSFPITHRERMEIRADDPDFASACRLLGIGSE